MKLLAIAAALCLGTSLTTAAMAAPRLDPGASSSIILVQKSDDKGNGGANRAAGRKDAKKDNASSERSNKGGETRGKDRASEMKDMNKAKKSQ